MPSGCGRRERTDGRELEKTVAIVGVFEAEGTAVEPEVAVVGEALVVEVCPMGTVDLLAARGTLPLGFRRKAATDEAAVVVGVVPCDERDRVVASVEALAAGGVGRLGAAPSSTQRRYARP